MSKIEDTIAKLLAKAEGTNHPAEAEAFMAKAEELMLKHGIELAHLEARKPGQKKREIIQVRITVKNGHGYANAMAASVHAAAPSFSVRTLKSAMPDGGQVIWLIGHKSDVEQVETLAHSLLAQSRSQAMHWWKTVGKALHEGYTDNDAYLARREFIFAFASGLRARLAETHSRIVEETGTALVLVERSKLVDNWIAENMKIGKARASSRSFGSRAASAAGNQAGRDAIGSKALR